MSRKYRSEILLYCLSCLGRFSHIPLVISWAVLFRTGGRSCGDSSGDSGGGVTSPLEVPSVLDGPANERWGVDGIRGSRMRREDEEDIGVMVVEDGREWDRAMASGGGKRIVGMGLMGRD